METPSAGKYAAHMTGKSDWLSWYITGHGIDMVHKVYSELRPSEPEPFSGWQRWTTDASLMGPADHDRLRRHLIAGGIVIVLGRPRFSKADFISTLTAAGEIHDEIGTTPSKADLPPPPFAIDDTSTYERQGVLTSIALATSRRRGFVLVFENTADFRAFDIGAYIANQQVIILEFSPS
jgi:hypothetical protein